MRGAHHRSAPHPISEMTYTVSSGTLNSTIPYHTKLSRGFHGSKGENFENLTDYIMYSVNEKISHRLMLTITNFLNFLEIYKHEKTVKCSINQKVLSRNERDN